MAVLSTGDELLEPGHVPWPDTPEDRMWRTYATALAWIGRELSRNEAGYWGLENNMTAAIRHAVHNEDQ